MEQVKGLEERALVESPLFDHWSAKDLLAHIAAWDRWAVREMQRMLAGAPPDLTALRDEEAFNAAAVAAWQNRTLAEVLAELQDARATWVAWLENIPEDIFFRRRLYREEDWSFPAWLKIFWQHDAEHAAQIAAWRDNG